MAATIGQVWGRDKNRTKTDHRLGSESSTVEAATWQTFARAHVNRDGSGFVEVRRNGEIIHRYEFPAEKDG